MERDPLSPDASGTVRPVHMSRRIWAGLVDGLAVLGTMLIVVLMVIICADVVARNLLGASLPLVSELGALTLVMIVYLQLATTVRHDRLARTEIYFERLKQRNPRAGRLLGAGFDAVGAVSLAVLAWSTFGILERDIASAQFIGVTGVATLPTWPFRALVVAGLTVATLQFALQVHDALRPPKDRAS